MTTDIERMKAELIEAGYVESDNGSTWQAPSGFTYFIGWENPESLETAHAHMLKERELADLRAKVADYEALILDFLDPNYTLGGGYPLTFRAHELKKKHNITDSESDDNG